MYDDNLQNTKKKSKDATSHLLIHVGIKTTKCIFFIIYLILNTKHFLNYIDTKNFQ